MGSSAGWADVLSFGGASAQRKLQRQQQAAAEEQAAMAEKAAKAKELAPIEVQAQTKDPMQAAEDQVNSANKRKRTLSSTAAGLSSYANQGAGRRTLG